MGQEIFGEFMAALVALAATYVSWQSRRSTRSSEEVLKEIRNIANRIDLLDARISTLEAWRNTYRVSPWRHGEGVSDWIRDHAREHEWLHSILADMKDEDER